MDYRIAPSATQDLKNIADYFLTRNIEAGESLFQEFNRKCQNLVNFPNIGRSYSHLCFGLRGLPLSGYIILYQVEDETIEILRVVSGYQNLETLFSDKPSQ
jgi:toxin ParE1/3/4